MFKKINNPLAIGLKKAYSSINQLSLVIHDRGSFFLKEKSIYQSGILQSATLKS
jgi:hypothetical protein